MNMHQTMVITIIIIEFKLLFAHYLFGGTGCTIFFCSRSLSLSSKYMIRLFNDSKFRDWFISIQLKWYDANKKNTHQIKLHSEFTVIINTPTVILHWIAGQPRYSQYIDGCVAHFWCRRMSVLFIYRLTSFSFTSSFFYTQSLQHKNFISKKSNIILRMVIFDFLFFRLRLLLLHWFQICFIAKYISAYQTK